VEYVAEPGRSGGRGSGVRLGVGSGGGMRDLRCYRETRAGRELRAGVSSLGSAGGRRKVGSGNDGSDGGGGGR
jgi:hypothetical protein